MEVTFLAALLNDFFLKPQFTECQNSFSEFVLYCHAWICAYRPKRTQHAAKASIEPDLKTELVIIENPLVDFDF